MMDDFDREGSSTRFNGSRIGDVRFHGRRCCYVVSGTSSTGVTSSSSSSTTHEAVPFYGARKIVGTSQPKLNCSRSRFGHLHPCPCGCEDHGSHEWSTWIVFGRMYNMPERVPYLVHTFTRCAVGIAESFSIVNYTYYYSTAA